MSDLNKKSESGVSNSSRPFAYGNRNNWIHVGRLPKHVHDVYVHVKELARQSLLKGQPWLIVHPFSEIPT